MKWIALIFLLLCGCASDVVLPPPQVTTTDFAVASLPNAVYLITYKGASGVPNQRLLDLALLKASQVTQARQLQCFVIIDQQASTPGEIKYRPTLPLASEWNNELLIQGFKGRPSRLFCFPSKETENAIYEKLRTPEQPETLESVSISP